MIFSGKQTIPANTAVTAPLRYVIAIDIGTIKTISVHFPYGCAGLVGVRVLYASWQIWPISLNEWLIGNDLILTYSCDYVVETEPKDVIIEAYNLDDTFDHTPEFIIETFRPTISQKLASFLETVK